MMHEELLLNALYLIMIMLQSAASRRRTASPHHIQRNFCQRDNRIRRMHNER